MPSSPTETACPEAHRRGTARRIPRPSLILLAFMMSLGPFGDTEYTPAMPDIAHSLAVDYGMVQFTMTAYLIGSSLSQLAYGPLADRHGRRPVMLWGAAILAAGLLVAVLSFDIWPLVGGRLVQGLGASAGTVIADTAVRDAFSDDRRQRIYARLNAAFALAPAVGPVAGTYLVKAMGWHANFGVLLALAIVLLGAVWKWLPETCPERDPHAAEPRRVWRNYKTILATRDFAFFATLGGFAVGVVYTALIGAPDLVINMLGRGSGGIAEVSGAILVAFVLGAGACWLATHRLATAWIVSGGLALLLAGAVWLMAVALLEDGHGTLLTFLLPIGLCFVGVGVLVPVTTNRAMAPFGDTAGTAASLLGAVRMGIASLATVAMSLLHEGSVKDMPIVFLGMSGLGAATFAGYLLSGRGRAGRAPS